MRHICSECNGAGEDPTAVALEKLSAVLPLRCEKCEGVGAIETCIVHLIAYPSDGRECPTCAAYIAGGL